MVTVGYTSRGLPASLGSDALGALVDSVTYDSAARLTGMRFPAGGGLWRTQSYYPWQDGIHSNSNGRLQDIRVGTSQGGDERLSLLYGYDSFGNIGGLSERYDGGSTSTFSFTYDDQNRLTDAFDQSYSYDHAGRLTGYEGTTHPVNSAFPIHAVKGDAYAYDANGNLTQRGDQTLTWDAENRLASVLGNGLDESYVYNADGIRVQKTSNGVSTYYPFPHYEVTVASSGTITSTAYYQFNGQPIALRRDGTLTYLHSDHLGSVALTTGGSTVEQRYYAYGRKRGGGTLPIEHNYTGQRKDASGLLYYNARYYDPELGAFISPDTIVPEPGVLFDYNRYLYVRGNPLRYSDPTGRCVFGLDTIVCIIAAAAVAGGAANATGNAGVQVYQAWDSERTIRENLNDFNKTEAGIAFGYGAIGGGLAPVTGGATALMLNGSLGAMQEVTNDVIVNGKTVSEAVDAETAVAAGLGVVGGLVQNSVPDELLFTASNGEILGVATGKDAVAMGGSWFAKITDSWLLDEQLGVVIGSRFVIGAGTGNVPIPEVLSEECSWSCPWQIFQDWWDSEDAIE